jgi:UTP--glucose-1-phosphate uridylyltransferase
VHHSERGVLAYAFSGTRYDAGDKLDYLRATVELAARRDDIGPSFVAFLRRFLSDLDRAAGRDPVDPGPPRH